MLNPRGPEENVELSLQGTIAESRVLYLQPRACQAVELASKRGRENKASFKIRAEG